MGTDWTSTRTKTGESSGAKQLPNWSVSLLVFENAKLLKIKVYGNILESILFITNAPKDFSSILYSHHSNNP